MVKFNLNLIGVILILALGITFSGCVSTPTDSPPTPMIPEVDIEYIVWFIDSGNMISTDLQGIAESSDSTGKPNFVSAEIWGKYLKEDSRKLLDEIALFNVSPSLQPSVDEYEKSLEKMYLAGKYCESGAQKNNMDDINMATQYTTEAEILLQRSMSLIPDHFFE